METVSNRASVNTSATSFPKHPQLALHSQPRPVVAPPCTHPTENEKNATLTSQIPHTFQRWESVLVAHHLEVSILVCFVDPIVDMIIHMLELCQSALDHVLRIHQLANSVALQIRFRFNLASPHAGGVCVWLVHVINDVSGTC